MKKKRPPAQKTGFRSAPFRSLKGFSAQQRSVGTPLPGPLQPDRDENEDDQFLRAVRGARRIQRDDAAAATSPAQPQPGPQQQAAEQDEGAALFSEAMRSLGTASFRDTIPEEDEHDTARRSTSSRLRRLRKGAIRIGEELDLHGFVRDEALRRLEHFIASACARGLPAVLVITGKGINSPEGPVLQGAVAEWLRRQGKGKVAEFHPAPREKGGSGAYVVFLKTAP